jgi:hypothetical protein
MMPDQIMTEVATVLATKATEAALSGGKKALTALIRLVRERFQHDPEAQEALEAAELQPGDAAAVAGLAQALNKLASEDPEFDAEIRELWPQVAIEADVVNTVTGTVGGHVVQARDIQGGIRFNAP